MIVVEGPDGSGKTTLVEYLSNNYDLTLVERAVNSDAEYNISLDLWIERVTARSQFGENLLLDRHQLISHHMYGPVMRRGTLYGRFNDLDWLQLAFREFWRQNPLVIICLPSLKTVKQNIENDEFKVASDDIEIYYANYHFWLASHMYRRNVVHWDYTCHSKVWLDRIVEEYLAEER